MMSIDASKILDTEMNRKEFLRNVGIGVVAFTGLAAALRAFSQLPSSTTGHQQAATGRTVTSAGYGASVYGGVKATHTAS